MLGNGAGEGLGAREEPLLEVGEDDEGAVADVLFLAFDLFAAERMVAVHHFAEDEFGRIGR